MTSHASQVAEILARVEEICPAVQEPELLNSMVRTAALLRSFPLAVSLVLANNVPPLDKALQTDGYTRARLDHAGNAGWMATKSTDLRVQILRDFFEKINAKP
jgi:hypothetical protein